MPLCQLFHFFWGSKDVKDNVYPPWRIDTKRRIVNQCQEGNEYRICESLSSSTQPKLIRFLDSTADTWDVGSMDPKLEPLSQASVGNLLRGEPRVREAISDWKSKEDTCQWHQQESRNKQHAQVLISGLYYAGEPISFLELRDKRMFPYSTL